MKRSLGAALDAKLFQDAGDVGLDRPLFDEEGARYLLVRLTPRYALEDLCLAVRKLLRTLGNAHLTH